MQEPQERYTVNAEAEFAPKSSIQRSVRPHGGDAEPGRRLRPMRAANEQRVPKAKRGASEVSPPEHKSESPTVDVRPFKPTAALQ